MQRNVTLGGNIYMDLNKKCKHCLLDLTSDTAAKKNAHYYRNECKKCRSKSVTNYMIGNPKRHKYMRDYIRRVGIVKQYPCETCGKDCYKKYARAFCSDKCRFMAYIDKQEECWLWTGNKNRRGYGKLSFKKKKTAIASRVSYELFKGPIKDGMYICHTCDVPSCVNPDHLWSGTHMENTLNMVEKGRQHAKLDFYKILDIRRLWDEGYSNAKLCELYKVTSGTISSIVTRRIWKHV